VIEIFTDGSAKGNPGRGGYGVILKYKSSQKELAKGYRLTTNNRMELLAVIVALESLKNFSIPISVTTDSKYVVDAVNNRWVFSWVQKGFKGKKNEDLWRRFLRIYPKFDSIEFKWVRGHNGHSENERCDFLAVQAAESLTLDVDQGYEEVKGIN
jgi:ribonuclease HI